MGRVKLHEVVNVNPEVWETREVYLKVKGTVIDDLGYYDKKFKQDDENAGNNNGKGEKISK